MSPLSVYDLLDLVSCTTQEGWLDSCTTAVFPRLVWPFSCFPRAVVWFFGHAWGVEPSAVVWGWLRIGELSLAQRLLMNSGQSRSRDGISPVGMCKTEDMFVLPLAACAMIRLEEELNVSCLIPCERP